jgi:predicted nucleic acid-binding Zn ribbon protein
MYMGQKKYARIGDILPSVLRSIGLDRRLREHEILAIWPQVVGAEIAARTQPIKIERGVLYVRVDHSAWMQELHFMEREILAKLRESAPDVVIDHIRYGPGR